MEKIDQFGTAVKAAQDRIDKAEKQLDGVDKEVIQKAAEDAAQSLQDIQDIKAKQESLTKTLELVEKQAFRGDGGGATDSTEAEYFEKFSGFLRHGKSMAQEFVEQAADFHSKSLQNYSEEAKGLIKKDFIAGINPSGGYWIRPERSSQMVTRIFETSPVRQVANIQTTTSDSFEMIVRDQKGSTGGWVGETQSRSKTSTAQIGLLTIPIHEIFAEPAVTQKMIDDAGFDIEGFVAQEIQRDISLDENTAFVNGDSSKKPEGFTTLPAWAVQGTYQRGALEQIPSGSATALTSDGVIDLQNSLVEFYQPGANWMMKRLTFSEIVKLKDGEDRYLINLNMLREGTDKILLGKPVIFADDFTGPTSSGVFATSSLPIVYGNFSVGYTIVDRFGFRLLRDEFTDKPNVLFYTTKRTGGAVTNFQSLKLQVVSA